MAAFTAESINILNGQDVAEITSAEPINTIQKGDFLVISGFPPVEILQAYKNGQGERFIELLKPWPHTSQANQPAIVIPTTVDYREAVEALRAANTLVSDNKKAMGDWQTNMGTVTFKDKDGNDVVVKTLRQIEADNQAQMNAYHPYPWAMRKVEFEAMRSANNEKYAASGFVHKGKRYLDTWNIGYIDSLYSPNLGSSVASNSLFFGSMHPSAEGESKQGAPKLVLAGVETQIEYISSSNKDLLNKIKLPPAENGTRTYDSATGEPVTHATATLAFATETATNKVVTGRVDMWGVEAFLREINDSDPFVYKRGLPQSLASSINGVATVDDNVRPITYFAWYEGDTTSRGKGVNWQTATEAQRIAIASDPKNNIYFDDSTGKFYQWCVRGRSFAGVGNGDWGFIENKENILGFSTYNRVYVKGISDSDESFVGSSDANHYRGFYATANDSPFLGVFTTHSQYKNSKGVNGECYFLVCDTVSRLNQGGYHPSLNQMGSGKLTSDGNNYQFWYEYTGIPLTSVLSVFENTRINTGAVGQTSGRSDNKYYDVIYSSGQGGVCRDMRYSARGLKAEDFAEADLKIKSGKYRGRERLPFSVPIVVGANSSTTYISLGSTKPKWWDDAELGTGTGVSKNISDMFLINPSTDEKLYVTITGYTESSNLGWYLRVSKTHHVADTSQFHNLSDDDVLILQTQGNESLCKTSVAGEYSHTEVIGAPSNILQSTDLKDGWVGNWNPTIPDGSGTRFPITKPALNTTDDLAIYSLDLGSSWLTTTQAHNLDLVTNSVSHATVFAEGGLVVYHYTTKAKVTVETTNDVIHGGDLGIGSVYACNWGGATPQGKGLGYSLMSKVVIGSNSFQRIMNYPITQGGVEATGKLPISNSYLIKHKIVDLTGVDSPAFKALNYNVAENQQAFINYAYTELHYDATAGDWGDDGVMHPASNQTTMPDENGHTVLVGTARCVEPLGWLKNDK
tara:strand:+ start:38334 stop:41243 length:2910 start_codon:yes stop_codon:yes gene_type:complete